MKVRKHFRTSSSMIDLIILDVVSNRVVNKDTFFNYCVNERLNVLSARYDEKLDKISSFIIMNCNFANLPVDCLSRMILSLSKITNALTKGIISILGK